MFNLINGFGGGCNQQIGQNPDEYAKTYAEQNGLSLDEAKAELKSKYGDPQQPNETNGIFSFNNSGNIGTQNITSLYEQIASLQEEIAELEEKLFNKTETNTTNSSNTSTNTEETTTTSETSSKSTNKIKEYNDKTLYYYLKNERGLSDDEISSLSSNEEKKYLQECQQHITWMNGQQLYSA